MFPMTGAHVTMLVGFAIYLAPFVVGFFVIAGGIETSRRFDKMLVTAVVVGGVIMVAGAILSKVWS